MVKSASETLDRPLTQKELLEEAMAKEAAMKAILGGGARLAEGLGGRIAQSGANAAKNWGGLAGMGSNRQAIGSGISRFANKLRGYATKGEGTALSIPGRARGRMPSPGGPTIHMGGNPPMRNVTPGFSPQQQPLGLPSPANRMRGRMPSPSAGPIPMGTQNTGMILSGGSMPVAGSSAAPTGGLGGMKDSVSQWMANNPRWAAGAGIAGAGVLGNRMGHSSGHDQGMNDAFHAYQDNSSGFGGTMKTLGNALGLVPDQNMFMPKGAAERVKLADFMEAVGSSNIQAEDMLKQALMGAAAKGIGAVGKSVLGGLGKQWGNTLSSGAKGLSNWGGRAATGALERGAVAGTRRSALGARVGGWGSKATSWGEGLAAPADKAINGMSGWGGSLARGARGVGNMATWGVGAVPGVSPAGLGMAAFAGADGLMNRKSWTEDGARTGAAQALVGAQNMTLGQRMGFLFNPSYVADRAAQQADGSLPGIYDQFRNLSQR